MPLHYLRRLTATERTTAANAHLARYLAFVAGAVNAGGFLAVHQYTSHMSGIVSAMADNLALGSSAIVFTSFAALISFLGGAFCTSVTIRWGRRLQLDSEYALPLIWEAGLLIVFGMIGKEFQGSTPIGTIMLLCFTMGIQNATITKISGAVIRTTHLTGMVTDIGIGLGRMVMPRCGNDPAAANDEVRRIRLLASLIALFFVGGVIGAVGFKHVGFLFTMPLAAVLLIMAAMPVVDDIRKSIART
jgi:uncharacterized membrane protein YoaK (UPF0700 family)